jgi:hypothetical protein
MFTSPDRPEVDHRTIKLIVGIVALSLAPLTSIFATVPLTSISASYYEGGWSQSIFVGFLFAIAAFLLAYNGYSEREMFLSKVAAAAGLGIALFPCTCEDRTPAVPFVHDASAAIMFLVLAYFCYLFFRRARVKGYPQAKVRSGIYVACGIAIILSILVLAFDRLSGGVLRSSFPRLTFYGEATGLTAFGISWLTASRVLPFITAEEERFSPLRETNPT